MFESAVIICDKKVITNALGQLVITAIMALLGVHFAYNLSYNPSCKQVLEFFQEKLLGMRLDPSRKITSAYSNLYRAVSCIEVKLKEGEQSDQEVHPADEDGTQAFHDF